MRYCARALGFPSGVGELLDHPTRVRLTMSLAMSAALALLDMAGVIAMLPLMQHVTGQPVDSGALGYVNRALSEPPLKVLVHFWACSFLGRSSRRTRQPYWCVVGN